MNARLLLKSALGVTTIFLGSLTTASVAVGTENAFAPFKAVYSLTFKPDGQIPLKSGSGRLTVEFTGSKCTEYKILKTMANKLQFEQGVLNVTSEAAMTENPAGTQFAFSFVERHNGNIQRQETVTARRDGGGIVATSNKIPGGKLQLPANVVFPIQNEIMLIDTLASGRKTLNASVYNPEITPSNIDRFSASVGAEVTSALPKDHPAAVDALAAKPRYRVKLTFADGKSGKVRAQEQLTRFAPAVFTVSDTTVDHMKIEAKLLSLTMLPQKPCP